MAKKKSNKRVVTRKKTKKSPTLKHEKIPKEFFVSQKSKAFQREAKIDLSQLKSCPECASDNIFYSNMRDELVCRDCGGIFSKLTPEQMQKYKNLQV